MEEFWNTAWLWLRTHGLRILLTLAIAYVLIRLLRRLTRRLEAWLAEQEEEAARDPVRAGEREQRRQTIRRVLDGLILVIIWVIAGTMILLELGVEIGPLLAGAGVVGIAISLGAQSLVKDILAGLFVLIEDQFAIGDVVAVAGVSGTVERITLRSTKLRDLEGTVHIVPNGEMRVISNKTKGWARAVLRVGVAYDTDLEKAMAVLRGVGLDVYADPAWEGQLLEEPTVSALDDLRDSDVTLLFHVKTAPGAQWGVAREVRKRVVKAFADEGIEMPYPTQVRLNRVISAADAQDT